MHVAKGHKSSVPWTLQSKVIAAIFLLAMGSLAWCCAFFLHFEDSGITFKKELSEDEQKKLIREELGRGTWNMLHRMAAKYDKEPTEERKASALQFFQRLGDFYPCHDCASHFRAMIARSPPVVDNNRALSMWLCERHNEVNARLNKALFPCTLEALGERWGDCGCFGNITDTAEAEAAAAVRSKSKARRISSSSAGGNDWSEDSNSRRPARSGTGKTSSVQDVWS